MSFAVSTSALPGIVPPLASNLASTPAGADYAFGWTWTQVRHLMIQNNTASALNWDTDQPATAGSPTLAAGATLFLDIVVSTLHLYTVGVQAVNGTAGGNIVVRAWF